MTGKHVAALVGAGIALAALGYAFGRHVQPAKLEVREVVKERTVTVEDTRAREQVRILTAQLESMSLRTRRETIKHTSKTGEVTEKTTETRELDRNKESVTDSSKVASLDSVRRAETDREKIAEKIVERKVPDWRVGVLAGSRLDLKPSFGVHAERRILGPISAGIFVLPQERFAGVSLSLEF